MRIAVCDDDSVYAKEIEKIVQTTLLDRHIESKTDLYCDSRELYESNKEYDIALNRLFSYRAYIIKGNESNSFHAFCQIYKNSQWYYVDARGVTSSFDEFIDDAKQFITNEYTIQPITEEDIKSWEQEPYFDDAIEFAKGIIKKYNSYYMI